MPVLPPLPQRLLQQINKGPSTMNDVENSEQDFMPPTIPVQTEFGLRLSALNPKYLHTNSTSHTWPFSAIAELVDNAYDPDVKASQLHIDLKNVEKDGETELTMTFTDNGNGMTSDKLYKMLSFGFCEKVAIKGHKPVGHYGNGFKSGSMRIGKDALVFTKNSKNRSLGFLSQTYLATVNADTIIVPMVTWDNSTGKIMRSEEENCSLPAILKYSVIESLDKIDEEFACIESESGTRIIISKLRRTKTDKIEFDITSENFDIRIPEDMADSEESKFKREERQDHIPASDYSLRAYLSILYLTPKMQIYLREKKVKTVVIRKSLSKTEVDVYRPNNEKPMKIVFGFSENVNHYGIMMYHCNRLIKPYVRVGCQLKANNMGVGVIGVIECGSLQPTHNKQDFDYTPLFRATMNAVGNKLNEYWNEKTKYGSTPVSPTIQKSLPDELWVQCDSLSCLKWRKLPSWVKKMDLPDKWYCHMHPDAHWADCAIPEEEENQQTLVTPYEKKLKKRTRQLKEMERLKIARQKAAEIQLEGMRMQRQEIKYHQQQEELNRLRHQLTKNSEQGIHVAQPPASMSSHTQSISNNPAMNSHSQSISNMGMSVMNNSAGSSKVPRIVPNSLMNGHGPVVSQVFSMQPTTSTQTSLQNPVKVEINANDRLQPRVVNEREVDKVRFSRQDPTPRGTRKRPINLDSDDEETPTTSSNHKNIKVETETETGNNPLCIDLVNSPQPSPEPIPEPKTEPPGSPEDTKSDRFIHGIERLLNETSEDVDEDEDKPVIDHTEYDEESTTYIKTLLERRSQALRNLRNKIYELSKILFPDVDLPDISAASIDDSSIEDFLDTVIDAHKNPSGSDEES